MIMLNDKYSFDLWLQHESDRQRKKTRYRKKFIGSRKYPHFDSTISLADAEQIGILRHKLIDKGAAESWNFYPFIKREQRNRKYRHNGEGHSPGSAFSSRNQKKFTHIKSRPIMYASHQDACVLAYSSFLLSKLFELEVQRRKIGKNVIAYRSIRGKNNVNFAHDAFRFLDNYKNYACILIDVKGFFDTIPHDLLVESVSKLFKREKIPLDMLHILKNITKYRYVIDDEVIKCLKKNKRDYFVRDKKKGFKLCKIEDFNELINNNQLIRTNKKGSGIPQGSPISGLLANIALLDFDSWLNSRLSPMTFYFYQRYSDDILIVCPRDDAKILYSDTKSHLRNYGLSLSSKKTEAFGNKNDRLENIVGELEPYNKSSRQNMQYLGLEWNGEQITLRPGTLSRRFRPKRMLSKPYWNYHRTARRKVGDKAMALQFDRFRRTIKKINEVRLGRDK